MMGGGRREEVEVRRSGFGLGGQPGEEVKSENCWMTEGLGLVVTVED
jgi:hypothetical protein